jgi:metal-responsive CopG/Arc/MetJ family transcriptional regulator
MQNITINVPELYLKNIQKLIDLNLVANRSEAIRTAIREYLQDEFSNLDLLDFFGKENKNDL